MTPSARRRGRLIAVEGIDGSGKSTFVRALAPALRHRGWSVAVRREPTDPTLGMLAQTTSVRDPWTGGVYFAVDRHLARPALEHALATHDLVLSDRSFFSTLAYQGSALPSAARRRVEQLQRRVTVAPDRAILLDLKPEHAFERLGVRAGRWGPLERRNTLRRVAKAYRSLARGPRWFVLDARLPTASLVALVIPRIERLLPTPRRASRSRTTRRRS